MRKRVPARHDGRAEAGRTKTMVAVPEMRNRAVQAASGDRADEKNVRKTAKSAAFVKTQTPRCSSNADQLLDPSASTNSTCSIGLASTQSRMSTVRPQTARLAAKRNKMSTMREFYERGDLPVSVHHPSTHPSGGSLIWEVEPQLLDYETYLPMFFGGLLECEEPYALFARRGVMDMLQHGDDDAVADAVPASISPLRDALITEDPSICVIVLEALQALVQVGKKSGRAFLPYLKNILPCLRRLLLKQKWGGYDDGNLDAGQRGVKDINSVVEETLHLLHRHGGKNAYVIIKSQIPMYEAPP